MFGEVRWPQVRGSFGLAGEKVRFLTCLKDVMWDTVHSYRLWLFILYLYFYILTPNSRNRHFLETVTIGFEWSEMKWYDIRWGSG